MIKGKANALNYGKISLASETEDMSSLVETLKVILKDCKYPEFKEEEEVSLRDEMRRIEAEHKAKLKKAEETADHIEEVLKETKLGAKLL